jgi:hypothetical protein
VDLTGVVLRAGATRPRVLAAVMPGATAVRLAAEEQLCRRGWPAAMTPADTDILLICGDSVLPLAEAVEDTWQAMPAPARLGHGCPSRRGGGAWRRPGRGSRTACPSRSWQSWARAGACCITAAPMAKSLVPAVTTGR